MTVLVNLIVTLGMLYVVPTGLRLIDRTAFRRTARLWPLLAAPGALCLWLPRGATATVLAALYAAAALALAARAPVRLLRTLPRTGSPVPVPSEAAVLTALVSPAVAGSALVAERAGYRLFGFDLDVLALTVPHFHFAGFTAALVAGLVCRATVTGGAPGTDAGRADAGRADAGLPDAGRAAAGPGAPPARWAAYSVPSGTLLVLLGYFIGDWAELVGAAVLTAGMWAVALATWRGIRPGARDRTTRTLLATSAGVLVATMLLALWWATGEATGITHPTLTWMAATHGLGNAVGFALCSLLAWRRLTMDRQEMTR
ncbi:MULTISPECIES: YndJ family protein [unclassified Streptomyces]|uniref:YndJ family protein n=1 Tax=unclassified Streptomyces TaxID=2593676 RepID=UPI002E2F8D6E|nr:MULTISPECIES: YndJ family protein [unclassified Streptomyces]WUC63666.1 YndJ family protein [Streptomyces sp. NBC_00539]